MTVSGGGSHAAVCRSQVECCIRVGSRWEIWVGDSLSCFSAFSFPSFEFWFLRSWKSWNSWNNLLSLPYTGDYFS